MSGRLVITFMAIACIAMGAVFYVTLKQSSNFQNLVTEQMAMEFHDYSKTVKKVERLKVAEEGSTQYFVSINPQWTFALHDKTLIVTTTQIETEPPQQAVSDEIRTKARSLIQEFVLVWLEDKYHSRKDLLVEIRIRNDMK